MCSPGQNLHFFADYLNHIRTVHNYNIMPRMNLTDFIYVSTGYPEIFDRKVTTFQLTSIQYQLKY